MRDYQARQGRVLPDGGPTPGELLKPVRVLGAKYKLNSDGTILSCEGTPASGSGFLTITLKQAKNESVDYDVTAPLS